MIFYVGLHQPSDARRFARAFVSINRLRTRRVPLGAGAWIMDSGAFTEIAAHGRYRMPPTDYAAQINRWAELDPALVCAVSQDYMCEPFILKKTGLTIPEHQALTLARFDDLRGLVRRAYVMPVLQGFAPADYVRHLEAYGDRLGAAAYVGVGSVCKRNADAGAIAAVLGAIKRARPDLRLHGFGLKTTALACAQIRELLFSADSMAWSFAARRQGRNSNDWREAAQFSAAIAAQPTSAQLFLPL